MEFLFQLRLFCLNFFCFRTRTFGVVVVAGGGTSAGSLLVRLNVEGREHVGEKTSVQTEKSSNWFGEVAVWLELKLDCVHEDDQELNLKKIISGC